MKILLCVSKTPDTTTKISFTPDKKSIETAGVQYILNPYDDHALARAMDLKEKTGSTLTVIHVGDNSAEQVLRKCLAVGADDAIRVDANPVDGAQTAMLIASAIEGKGYDLIITGRESIDFNGNIVGEYLAELLGVPSVSFITSIDLDSSTAKLSRFIDGGEESLEVPLPVVVSATKELAEPRIPNMRGIMTARTKPIEVVAPATAEKPTELVELQSPPAKGTCVYIDAAEAEKLIELLHTKERLI